jgi:hypothetical protein
VSSWHGLFVPAQTPREIVRKLNADTIAALADPVTKGKLEQAGYAGRRMLAVVLLLPRSKTRTARTANDTAIL